MAVKDARARIQEEVLAWEGTRAHPHRFNAVEFRLGSREIGHLHGDSLLDIPFPSKVRDELVGSGEAEPHHIVPESGWITFRIRGEEDLADAIALLRRSYEIALRQRPRSAEA